MPRDYSQNKEAHRQTAFAVVEEGKQRFPYMYRGLIVEIENEFGTRFPQPVIWCNGFQLKVRLAGQYLSFSKRTGECQERPGMTVTLIPNVA